MAWNDKNFPRFELRKAKTVWLKPGLISQQEMPDAERHDIPHHIVYCYLDEQGCRCTRFVANVVDGPQAVETAEQLVKAVAAGMEGVLRAWEKRAEAAEAEVVKLKEALKRLVDYVKSDLVDVCKGNCEHLDCAAMKEELNLADSAMNLPRLTP
jgi:hypothetical protein